MAKLGRFSWLPQVDAINIQQVIGQFFSIKLVKQLFKIAKEISFDEDHHSEVDAFNAELVRRIIVKVVKMVLM